MNNEQRTHFPYQSYFIMTYKQAISAHWPNVYIILRCFPSARADKES